MLPKKLEINIKYLTENYVTENLKKLIAKEDFQIFQYVFKILNEDQKEILKYFSFLNPQRISVKLIKLEAK